MHSDIINPLLEPLQSILKITLVQGLLLLGINTIGNVYSGYLQYLPHEKTQILKTP